MPIRMPVRMPTPRNPTLHANADPAGNTASTAEIDRFQALADAWWDSQGAFKPLHLLNRPRLQGLTEFAARHFGRDLAQESPFSGLSRLDIGCGGGLLCEPM